MPQNAISNEVGTVAENAHIIELLTAVVRAIDPIVPGNAEVALHDLAKLPESIVAIAGSVTGRTVGDPATDVLLEAIVSGIPGEALASYTTTLPNGQSLSSSTTIIRNMVGEPVAALCVNADLEAWERLSAVVAVLDRAWPGPERPGGGHKSAEALGSGERFAHDVDELATHVIADTLAKTGVPVELMRKDHKVAAVARLRERGIFLLKDSVETVAQALQVTRFTIYNYLNELDAADSSKRQVASEDDDSDIR